MVAAFTSIIHCCEEPLPTQAIWVTYHARSARSHWGSNDRSVARPSESFLGGVPAIGICPGRHCVLHFWQTTHQSPYYHLFLGLLRSSPVLWMTMIDVCPLLSMFCPINFLCCHPYYSMFLCTYCLAPEILITLFC